jgi:hypothetical protein
VLSFRNIGTASCILLSAVLYVPIDIIANSSRRISNVRFFFGGKNGWWDLKEDSATVTYVGIQLFG